MPENSTCAAGNLAQFPAPEPSLQSLVFTLWKQPLPPHRLIVPHLREALYGAALDEIRLKRHQGTVYDPAADNRFKWACQWLEVSEGNRPVVDVNLAMTVEYLFTNARVLCGKELASGELQTLALG